MKDLDRFLFPSYQDKRLKDKNRVKHRLEIKEDLFSCSLCFDIPPDKSKLQRHRIDPEGTYDNENTIILCQICHSRMHKIINKMKKNNEPIDYKLVILMAKLELDK